jgi:hypothetical protein
MPKLSELEKKLAPARAVTVCLPALIRSASTCASVGKGPMPSSPFSDCSQTSMPVGDVVRDERRHADAQVHDESVAEFLGGRLGDLIACKCHGRSVHAHEPETVLLGGSPQTGPSAA